MQADTAGLEKRPLEERRIQRQLGVLNIFAQRSERAKCVDHHRRMLVLPAPIEVFLGQVGALAKEMNQLHPTALEARHLVHDASAGQLHREIGVSKLVWLHPLHVVGTAHGSDEVVELVEPVIGHVVP